MYYIVMIIINKFSIGNIDVLCAILYNALYMLV